MSRDKNPEAILDLQDNVEMYPQVLTGSHQFLLELIGISAIGGETVQVAQQDQCHPIHPTSQQYDHSRFAESRYRER